MLIEVLRWTEPLRALSTGTRYGLTAALVAGCLALRFAVAGIGGAEALPIFLFFIPAVVLASVLFDTLSGFFATVLSALAAIFFFADPVGSFRVADAGHLSGLIAFITIGFIAAVFIEALRGALDELVQRRDALTRRTEELNALRAALQASNDRMVVLLADINHRIKNHLASIAAGLVLDRAGVDDERAREALNAAARRLNVLGRVYTQLHLHGTEVRIDVKEFLESLCSDLSASIIGTRPMVIDSKIEAARMDAQQAANLGLIVNELVTNAVKHAFPEAATGRIVVQLGECAEGYQLEVSDDGVGSGSAPGAAGAGTRLVEALAGQLGGVAEWDRNEGTTVVVRFEAKAGSTEPNIGSRGTNRRP